VSDAIGWLESFPQWPAGDLGLERIRALLARLGEPQRAYGAVHVVGTKGKSTAARTVAALLRADGLSAAAYTSPHVAGWWERLDTDEAGLERALTRVRADAEAVGASQFEILTAAAFADFAERGVDVAVVEAGVGGRLDATNVLDARIVLLTNVSLEHTELLGETREAIAREKLAVAGPRAIVVLPDDEFAGIAAANEVRLGGPREAAEAFAGHPIDAQVRVELAGRLEVRPGEVRDGAHTPEAVDWLLARLEEPGPYIVVASMLADKDVDRMLERLAGAGSTLVATQSSNDRSLPAADLARRAERWFPHVERVDDPAAALARAHDLGSPVLVTGSLYLLADLSAAG
jgi:dihydrofolate synthase/folylpolyglutamate synthase